MSVRLVLLALALGTALAGCVTTGNGDDIERMERNHNAALETTA
jgi:hypothetical protein